MADALNVKPAVAIAAAAKPIAILRIMMLTSNRSEHPSFPNQTQRFSLSCSARHSRPVSRLQNPSLWWRGLRLACHSNATASFFFQWELGQQVRPIASDNAAYFVIDGSDDLEAFLDLPADQFKFLRGATV
jgi:hypothetical protein